MRPFPSLRDTTPDFVPKQSLAEPVGPANPGFRPTSKLQPELRGGRPRSFGVVPIQSPAIFPSWFRVMGVPSPALLRSWLCPSPVMIHTRQRQHPRSLQASPFYSPFLRPERSRSGSRTPPPTATRFKALWATGFPASSPSSYSAPVPIASGHHTRLSSLKISCRTSRSCQPRVPLDFQVAS